MYPDTPLTNIRLGFGQQIKTVQYTNKNTCTVCSVGGCIHAGGSLDPNDHFSVVSGKINPHCACSHHCRWLQAQSFMGSGSEGVEGKLGGKSTLWVSLQLLWKSVITFCCSNSYKVLGFVFADAGFYRKWSGGYFSYQNENTQQMPCWLYFLPVWEKTKHRRYCCSYAS